MLTLARTTTTMMRMNNHTHIPYGLMNMMILMMLVVMVMQML